MKPTLSRARGTQNLNSSPLRYAKSVMNAVAWSRMTATCLDIVSVAFSPFFREEATNDLLIESILVNIIVLPHCIGRD